MVLGMWVGLYGESEVGVKSSNFGVIDVRLALVKKQS